ncbi:MAG: Lrp/AsnC ligand binding domain-containing protein [Anaerolineales bacterium]|nr:Lrp/AsnC ligand binding domain-containing protein [Anaerolineales bacterium]
MKAYVLIDIRTGDISQVVGHLKRVEGVIEADVTFGPYDAVAIVEGVNVEQIGRIITSQIQPIPGVLETLTCLAIEIL